MRRSLACLHALVVLFGCAAARADSITARPGTAEDPTMRSIRPERRNGVVLGATGGIGFAGASGYPKNQRLQGNPDYYSESPLLVGYSMSYFLMGALNDYVSFGPLLNIATFDTPKWKSTGWALGFRGEVFPFVRLGPMLADIAGYAQLGFGTTELRAKGPYPSAEGSQSFFGLGVHHEFRLGRLLGGHAAAGPYTEYNLIRSDTAERHWLSVGIRLVWYGGGVALDDS
jgi:hypothetical protein